MSAEHEAKIQAALFGEPITDWHRWFAWRPVHTLDRGWRWLRPLWRRRCLIHDYLDNRGPDMWFQHVVVAPPAARPEPTDTAALLAEHETWCYPVNALRPYCICGADLQVDNRGLGGKNVRPAHRAHLAAVLDAANAEEVQAAQEKALRDAADIIDATQFYSDGDVTHWLRDRADALRAPHPDDAGSEQ